MDYKAFQDSFDYIKWMDSFLAGKDQCGEYHFCQYCNKTEEYPCARASERSAKRQGVRIAIIHLKEKV